jgi:hypothetical protein
MSAAMLAPSTMATIDATALADRLKQAMVRPDHAFSPFDAETRAMSVGWVIGDKAIVALGGSSVQVIDAFMLTCSNDLGWMLLKQANAETSPLFLARMFGMGGPVDRLIIKTPDAFLQKCVMINRVVGPNIPHTLRTNYERDEKGSPIIYDTPEAAFKSELGPIYKYVKGAAVFRHCVRFEDGCILE